MSDTRVHRRGGTSRARRHRPPGWRGPRLLYLATRAIPALLLAAAAIVGLEAVAWAQEAPTDPGPDSIQEVVNRMRIWLVGILVAVSTLFLTVGGFRLMWANGDPGEIDKGKTALRNAAIGYGLAILAPLFVTILTGFLE